MPLAQEDRDTTGIVAPRVHLVRLSCILRDHWECRSTAQTKEWIVTFDRRRSTGSMSLYGGQTALPIPHDHSRRQ